MEFINGHLGESAALLTALFWAITSVFYEGGAKKIGTLNLNLFKVLLGTTFIAILTSITRGHPFPIDATIHQWGWLFLSGMIGLVIGDLLFIEALIRLGSRISTLIYSSVPPMSGILAYIFLGESMTRLQIIGMIITISGIGLVIFITDNKKVGLSHPVIGVLFAFGGALGQAGGYIIAKYGMGQYDPFSATQIRLISGIVGFSILFTIRGQWKSFFKSLKDVHTMKRISIGVFFGSFLGISLSLYAVQRINPGVASTLMALTPIILIMYVIFIKKEKVVFREILGTIIALTGVGIMFI